MDRWDYAIAGGCGLFAAMLDLLFVRAPAVPTASWLKGVDGVFNRAVQRHSTTSCPAVKHWVG